MRSALCLLLVSAAASLGCDPKPQSGTLLLDLARSGRPGLELVTLPIQRVDLLYQAPPADVPVHGPPPHLTTQCDGLAGSFTPTTGPFLPTVDFPIGAASAETVAVVSAPVGEIQEIHILFAQASATFATGQVNLKPTLGCSDETTIVDHGKGDEKKMVGKDEHPEATGLIRIRPTSGTFTIRGNQQTEVRARFNAMVDLIQDTDDPGDDDWQIASTLVGEEIPPSPAVSEPTSGSSDSQPIRRLSRSLT